MLTDPIKSSRRARRIRDKPLNTVFGLSPARLGIISLISACLAWASLPLIVVVEVFLALCVFAPLVLTSVVTGLVGVGAGIYYKYPVATAWKYNSVRLIYQFEKLCKRRPSARRTLECRARP